MDQVGFGLGQVRFGFGQVWAESGLGLVKFGTGQGQTGSGFGLTKFMSGQVQAGPNSGWVRLESSRVWAESGQNKNHRKRKVRGYLNFRSFSEHVPNSCSILSFSVSSFFMVSVSDF